MGFLFENEFTEIFVFITTLLLIVTGYFHNAYKYWARKGVPTIPPRFPFGNNNVLLPRGFTLGTLSKTFYEYLKENGHRFGGVYLLTEPNLVIVDPGLVKDILSKDFHCFTDRGFYFNEKDDPISANLFSRDGEDWKRLRTKLTPTFTSAKMKMMFEQVVECSNNMVDHLEKKSKVDTDIDIKEILGRYTTDVIGSCAFGIECNSFKDPNAEFRQMGKKIFYFGIWRSIRAFLITSVPKLSHFLRLTNNNKDVREFFINLVAETVRVRKEKQTRRNDFIQILMDLEDTANFSLNEMAGQVFLFFIAGFESSSTVMSFALYELAKNPEYQNKLREEIREVSAKYDNQITYRSLSEMEFLGQVFDETLRLYPPGTTLTRRAVKDYKLTDSNVVIEKGTPIIISPLGLHMDSEYFPEPEKFDPGRFSSEKKKLLYPGVYLPFGDGPRNCIGGRFGTMQSKMGIISVIRNFRVSVSPKTKPIKFDPTVFLLRSIDPVYLTLEKI